MALSKIAEIGRDGTLVHAEPVMDVAVGHLQPRLDPLNLPKALAREQMAETNSEQYAAGHDAS
jgi:hypothetical protein